MRLLQRLVAGSFQDLYKRNHLNSFRHTRGNATLKDIHHGESCFILCTGPSVSSQNLLPLASKNCIAVSNFYLHSDFLVIKPKYYCLAPWHPPHDISAYKKLVYNVIRSADQLGVFLDSNVRSLLIESEDSLNSAQARKIYFVDNSASLKTINPKDINLASKILRPQSVSIMALQVAIYLGFDSIFLLGCDHDSILNKRNNFANRHFYDETRSILKTDVSHSFKDELYSLASLWHQYEFVLNVARLKGVKIYNATPDSLLDLFPLISLEQALCLSSHDS